MNRIHRYKAKLVLIPLMIIGFIYVGIFISGLESQAQNIKFTGVRYFILLSILPPVVLGFYYRSIILEQRKLNKWKEDKKKK